MKKYLQLIIAIMLVFIIVSNSFATNLFTTEINDADKKQVVDIIINDLISWGYSVLTINEYQLSFRKDMDNSMAQIFLGSNFNRTPELRATFNIVSINNNVKITLEVKAVTNPNSGFEHYTPITHASWQTYLNGVKGKFNGYTIYGIAVPEKKKNRAFEIFEITNNSSAEKEGLVKGDLILMINDIKTSTLRHQEFLSYLDGPIGSTIKLSIKSLDGTEKTVILTKTFIPGEFQEANDETNEEHTEINIP